mgnify:CR=1 FL=1
MHTKRMIAYIIDLIFITAILIVLFNFFPNDLKANKIQTQIDQIGEEYAIGKMDKMSYFMTLSSLEKELDKNQALEIVINSILIVIYYIMIPYMWNGKTLGKHIMKIKIVSKKDTRINLMSLFIRTFIVNGLFSTILIIMGIYMIPKSFYLSFVSILAILQLLALIVSYFMIKYRQDSLGLEDILSQSKVIKLD